VIKRFLNHSTNSIASAAVIVASFSVLSRIVGFFRDRIFAGAFGAGDELDIYFTALRLPDLMFQLTVVGALSASFIPLFIKYYSKKNQEKAWDYTNNMLNLLALIFAGIVLLAWIFTEQLIPLIAAGFDPEKQAQVAELSRIMFGAQFLLAISMVFSSALQGVKRFVLYAIAPVLYNVGIIFGALVFVPRFGVEGLAWGVVLGAFLHLTTQFVGVSTLGYRYKPVLKFNDDVRYMRKHMLPRVLGLGVGQLNIISMTIIASTLTAGSVTMLQFAYNLNFFPIGVVAVSYAVAAFPTFCDLYNKNKISEFSKSLSATVRQILLFMIPSTVSFIFLRAQAVRIVFGAGEFDWSATIITADTLGFFAVSFIAQSLVFLLVRVYFAMNDTMTPFLVGVLTAAINIGFSLIFTKEYGVVGFGIAYSIASFVQMFVLWIVLRIRIGSLNDAQIFKSFISLSIAGVGMALVMQFIKTLLGETLMDLDKFGEVFLQGAIAGILGLGTYIGIALILRSPEMTEFLRGMKRKLFKRVRVQEEIVTDMT